MVQLDLFDAKTLAFREGRFSGIQIPQKLEEAVKLLYDFRPHVLEQKWMLSSESFERPLVSCLGYHTEDLVLIMFEDGTIDECGPFSLFPVVNKNSTR